MTTPRLGRLPTCLSCLRQLTKPTPTSIVSPVSFIQIRNRTTKAELEDLQGIPVRLLEDIIGFGRKHAIIRVKPGRMRNFWFPKGQAEYMTRLRFNELGLTSSAIGVRDRTFGTKLVLEEDNNNESWKKPVVQEEPVVYKKKEVFTLPPEETQTLLTTLLPSILTFYRKPIATPTPAFSEALLEPPRSPALAPDAATSPSADEALEETQVAAAAAAAAAPEEPGPVAIFGSVSTTDILHLVKEILAVDSEGARVALEAENITILGLDEGEDRIKRIGTFAVEILAGKDLPPVRRIVAVVPDS